MCIYVIHVQIPTYTYLYIYILTERQLIQCFEVEAAIYMQIHADTCIYMQVRIYFHSVYIWHLYVHILYIRAYTCKVKNGDLALVPFKEMHIDCLYFDVYVRVWCSILYVYYTHTRISYVYARIDAISNFA